MGGLYGPNTVHVERFLERLKRLTYQQWHEVLARAIVPADASLAAEAVRAADAGAMRHGRNAAVDAAMEAARRHLQLAAASWRDEDALDTKASPSPAPLAAAALVLRDVLSRWHFTPLYAPFAPVIPLVGLKMSRTYGTRSPQVKRFLNRLMKLTQPQWWQVLEAQAQLRHATPELDRERSRVSAPETGVEALVEAIARGANSECDAARIDARAIAGVSWDAAMHGAEGDVSRQVDTEGREAAKRAAEDAVTALVIRDRLVPQLFAAWYAPFARAIPSEDLTGQKARAWLSRWSSTDV